MKIRQYPPIYNCQTIPGGSGHCTVKQQWPFVQRGNQIVRPILNYDFKRTGNGTSCGFSEFNLPVIYTGQALNELLPGDTLIFQTGVYFLYRK